MSHNKTRKRKGMEGINIAESIVVALVSGLLGFFASWLNYKKDREKDKADNRREIKASVDEMSESLMESQQKRIDQLTLHIGGLEERYCTLLAKYDALLLKYDAMKDKYEAEIAVLRERVRELESKRGGE